MRRAQSTARLTGLSTSLPRRARGLPARCGSRFPDAAGDIWQHRIRNPEDWDDDWVFFDDRFNLLRCEDELFGRFLAEVLHPVLRRDRDEVRRLANFFNEVLAGDDCELVEVGQLSGRPVFAARQREAYRTASGADMMELYKEVQEVLALNAEAAEGSGEGSRSAVKALRALVTTIQSLAELRNELGLGHGRASTSPALTRHARLAFTAPWR